MNAKTNLFSFITANSCKYKYSEIDGKYTKIDYRRCKINFHL